VNLIILDPGEIGDAGGVRLSGPRASHLLNALKVSAGQPVRVGVLDGPLGMAVVQTIADASVDLQCEFDTAVPPRPLVDVLLALPRPKVMRRLWSQIAALGVGRILLTNAERVERNYFDAHAVRPEHYRPLLIEGLQQARDTRLPIVSVHRQLKVLVEDQLDGLVGGGLRLVADHMATNAVSVAARESAEDRILLAIGPEGGWNDFERALLRDHGFQAVAIGPRTLRSDTACIALLALVHDSLDRRAGTIPVQRNR
jgi:RsmE family RNA methyltransferase